MRRRFFTLSLVAMPLSTHAQSDEWQTIVGPDLRFRLQMPPPVTQNKATETEKGHAGPRSAWAAKRDGQIFDFDYVDYQPGWFSDRNSKEMANNLGRGVVEKAFPQDKYKYLRDEAVTLQGWDGYALDILDPGDNVVMMRTYIVKDRLYRLLVTAKNDAETKAIAERFLDSLKFAETRPAN